MVDDATESGTLDNVITEEHVEQAVAQNFTALTDEERASMSKVLFPDTDTSRVCLIGVDREIRPIPIKWARLLYEKTKTLSKKIHQGMAKPQESPVDDEVVQLLSSVGKTLAEFYGWDDVIKAIDSEEMTIGELQSLFVIQTERNGKNDFLLGPSRVVINVMRLQELIMMKFQNMSITRQSLKNGISPSTNS